MKFRGITYYLFALLSVSIVSCQHSLRRAYVGDVVAMVDNVSLTREEVASVVPSYLKGADSIDFVKRYVDNWLRREVKADEAERVFATSAHDIENLVNSYRQALLSQRLDHFFVGTAGAIKVNDEDVLSYYNKHNDIFRLDRPIVKGRILRLPLSHANEAKYKSLMSSSSKDSRLDLISISEKDSECELNEFTDQWIDYDEFMARLPIARDSKSAKYMQRKGVQSMKDSEWSYLFEITAYRSSGYVAPLEIVEDRIRRILTNDLQVKLIREREEALFEKARQQGIIYNSLDK